MLGATARLSAHRSTRYVDCIGQSHGASFARYVMLAAHCREAEGIEFIVMYLNPLGYALAWSSYKKPPPPNVALAEIMLSALWGGIHANPIRH
jgi:hypothetical protein